MIYFRTLLGALAILIVFLAFSQSLYGQDYLSNAKIFMDLTGDDVAQVSIHYKVIHDTDQSEIPLAGLLFGIGEVSDVRALFADSAQTIKLSQTSGGRVTGSIAISRISRIEGESNLELIYDVHQAKTLIGDLWSWQVPILTVMWPPVVARPGTVTIETLMPLGYSVIESLPINLRILGENEGGKRYVTEMPAMPSLVSIRATDKGERVTIMGILNFAVPILLFGSISFFGWRHIREPG